MVERSTFQALWKTESLQRLISALAPHRLFLVGGSVRDALRACPIADFDLVIETSPTELIGHKEQLAKKLEATVIVLDGVRGILRVCYTSQPALDLACCQGKSILDDLRQRDFTLNAMAIDPSGTLYDPTGGRLDLAKQVLRMTSAEVFEADPLRILRAFRLAATLSYQINSTTFNALRRSTSGLKHVAGERIREELLSFLSWATPPLAFQFQKARIGPILWDLADHLIPWSLWSATTANEPRPHHALAALGCLTQANLHATVNLCLSRKQQTYLNDFRAGITYLSSTIPRTRREQYHFALISGSAYEQVLSLAGYQDFANPLPFDDAQQLLAATRGTGGLHLTPLPLKGEDLCRYFNRPPGPWLKPLLKELRAAWACQEAITTHELLMHAQAISPHHP